MSSETFYVCKECLSPYVQRQNWAEVNTGLDMSDDLDACEWYCPHCGKTLKFTDVTAVPVELVSPQDARDNAVAFLARKHQEAVAEKLREEYKRDLDIHEGWRDEW